MPVSFAFGAVLKLCSSTFLSFWSKILTAKLLSSMPELKIKETVTLSGSFLDCLGYALSTQRSCFTKTPPWFPSIDLSIPAQPLSIHHLHTLGDGRTTDVWNIQCQNNGCSMRKRSRRSSWLLRSTLLFLKSQVAHNTFTAHPFFPPKIYADYFLFWEMRFKQKLLDILQQLLAKEWSKILVDFLKNLHHEQSIMHERRSKHAFCGNSTPGPPCFTPSQHQVPSTLLGAAASCPAHRRAALARQSPVCAPWPRKNIASPGRRRAPGCRSPLRELPFGDAAKQPSSPSDARRPK